MTMRRAQRTRTTRASLFVLTVCLKLLACASVPVSPPSLRSAPRPPPAPLTPARSEEVDPLPLGIAELEAVLSRAGQAGAEPIDVPTARLRLAFLYDTRVRLGSETSDLTQTFAPVIDLYLTFLHDNPNHPRAREVLYYLAHALTDSARLEEGEQARRAFVCPARYSVRPDATKPGAIALEPLDQDHDEKFWNAWEERHEKPLDWAGTNPLVAPEREELVYRNPYPPACDTPAPGSDRDVHLIAETWWQIGNYHFDQIDPRGGPYNLNRAGSAYEHALRYEVEPMYGVSIYKLAWTFFKQQRYRAATEWFVKLLEYTDELEKRTGDPGADFRSESYTYIAGSLTYVDFDGPPPWQPLVPRTDVVDLPDAALAERKMAVTIDRVQDAFVIPQDKKWTVEIYKSLAQEFTELTQNRNAIRVLELTLQKFPTDRDAPILRNKIAELHDQLYRLASAGSTERSEHWHAALEQRSKLALYSGGPWLEANKNDSEALETSRRLVLSGLKRAAVDRTNNARAFHAEAASPSTFENSDEGPKRQERLLEATIAEYRHAEQDWTSYLAQSLGPKEAYETQFWLADVRYWIVIFELTLHTMPSDEELKLARESAATVRDSTDGDQYVQPAAYYEVSIADEELKELQRLFDVTGGQKGLKERRSPASVVLGIGPTLSAPEPIPSEIQAALRARENYVRHVPRERDTSLNRPHYGYENAVTLERYGHLEEATERAKRLYSEECRRSEWGHKAWVLLLELARRRSDRRAEQELVERQRDPRRSCALTAGERAEAAMLITDTQQGAAESSQSP